MTWKDIFTEVLFKFGIDLTPKKKPVIKRNDVQEFMTTSQIIKGRVEREFHERLRRRSTITSYLRTDDLLFEPYINLLASTTIGRDHFSFVRETGSYLLHTAKQFEQDHGVIINKRHLYFGFAINSIYMNDTINSMVYWELCQQEESNTMGTLFNPVAAINSAIDKFTSVISPIDVSLNENDIFTNLHTRYDNIGSFKDTIGSQAAPEVFAYLASGLRYRQIDYWLRNNFTEMSKLFAQELLNSLCILCEANLKNHPGVTERMLGPILNNDLVNVNATVSAIVGGSGSGLFTAYPTGTDLQFDTNFPLLIARIKTNALTKDELSAHLIYGSYMLRNKGLHDFKSTLGYYNNRALFMDAIGLLFAAVPAIRNL